MHIYLLLCLSHLTQSTSSLNGMSSFNTKFLDWVWNVVA